MIVGTAGHIDHGKTSLVKALTGVDADRLPEEKARGITLDLGYAYSALPAGGVLGFVDVPGHEKLVHNMLAGATGIDYVLLVVAADDGPMPQTHEHLQILQLLGLTRGVVALTKIDTVSPQRVVQAQTEVLELLAHTALQDVPLFRVSSVTGEGVGRLRAHLGGEAGRLPARPASGRFRLAVDRCFTLTGAGTVVTGTAVSGRVTVGDSLVLSPPGVAVRVRSIHAQNQPSQQGVAGQRCALNLVGEGFEKSMVERGHWVLDAALHAPTQRLDVSLRLLRSEQRPLEHWTPVHLHLGAAEVMARVALLESQSLLPGRSGIAQLVLDRPIGALHGDRFVIRDQSALRTFGGGVVLDPSPPTRGRRTVARLTLLHGWGDASPAQGLDVALKSSLAGVDLRRFAQSWNLTDAQVEALAHAAGARLVGPSSGPLAVAADAWPALRQRTLEALAAEHRRAPDMIGVGRERLRRLAMVEFPQTAFDDLVQELIAEGSIVQSGPWLHAPDHQVRLTFDEERLWAKVQPLLQEAPFQPPRVRDLSHALLVEEDRMRQLLKHMARIGEVYPVAHDHYFTQAAVAELARVVRELASEQGAATAAAFRDRVATGRKLAIQILEFFDRVGFTRRVNDTHVLRQPGLFSGPGSGLA